MVLFGFSTQKLFGTLPPVLNEPMGLKKTFGKTVQR